MKFDLELIGRPKCVLKHPSHLLPSKRKHSIRKELIYWSYHLTPVLPSKGKHTNRKDLIEQGIKKA